MTDQFHPGKCLPDCMMPDGGECCPGYVALYDAYWNLLKGASAPPAQTVTATNPMAIVDASRETERDELVLLQQRLEFAEFEWNRATMALKAASAVVVPEGWQLVPKESNRTMTMHACDMLPSCEHVFGHAGKLCADVYRKMLEAAPAFSRHDRASTDIVEDGQS